MTISNIIEEIQNDHENVQSDAPQMFPEAASDGDFFRQGDVYIVYRDKLPDQLTNCLLYTSPSPRD